MSLRTLINKAGTIFDSSKTDTLFAEDWNAIQPEITAKQDALGYTPENVANKKITLSENSDTYYPSQKAVKSAVDAKQDALGFTAENVANKDTTTTLGTSDTKYPSQNAVKTYVDDGTRTQTLTNKRIGRRVITTTQSATPTINTDNTDCSLITALAQAITSFTTNLSGTPQPFDLLEIRITDNGSARAITWGAKFAATTVALPTTTVISTPLRVLFEWNATTSIWDCVAVV